jgi:hypothetical protein
MIGVFRLVRENFRSTALGNKDLSNTLSETISVFKCVRNPIVS